MSLFLFCGLFFRLQASQIFICRRKHVELVGGLIMQESAGLLTAVAWLIVEGWQLQICHLKRPKKPRRQVQPLL